MNNLKTFETFESFEIFEPFKTFETFEKLNVLNKQWCNIYTDKNKMIKKEIIYESNTNFLKGNLHDTHFTIQFRHFAQV